MGYGTVRHEGTLGRRNVSHCPGLLHRIRVQLLLKSRDQGLNLATALLNNSCIFRTQGYTHTNAFQNHIINPHVTIFFKNFPKKLYNYFAMLLKSHSLVTTMISSL